MSLISLVTNAKSEFQCGEMDKNAFSNVNSNYYTLSSQTQFPWMATITFDPIDLVQDCYGFNGILVSTRHVVISSRAVGKIKDNKFCYFPLKKIKVVLGSTQYGQHNENGSLIVGVRHITENPNITIISGKLINAFVILHLAYNIQFSEFISPVCLITEQTVPEKYYFVGSDGFRDKTRTFMKAYYADKASYTVETTNSFCSPDIQKFHGNGILQDFLEKKELFCVRTPVMAFVSHLSILFAKIENKFYLIGEKYSEENFRRRYFCPNQVSNVAISHSLSEKVAELIEDMTKISSWIQDIIKTDKTPLKILTPEPYVEVETKKPPKQVKKEGKSFLKSKWFAVLMVVVIIILILVLIYFSCVKFIKK